jgi:hypothetical protein
MSVMSFEKLSLQWSDASTERFNDASHVDDTGLEACDIGFLYSQQFKWIQ